MTFANLGLSETVLQAISDAGYTSPTPIQEKAIPNVLMGRDILAIPDDDWSNASVVKTARQILKAAIDFYLGGKQLHSRKLYRDFKVSRTLF